MNPFVPYALTLGSYTKARISESQGLVKDAIYYYKKAIYTNDQRDLAVRGYVLLLHNLGQTERAINFLLKTGNHKHHNLLAQLTGPATQQRPRLKTLLMEMKDVKNFVISPFTLPMLVPNVSTVHKIHYPCLNDPGHRAAEAGQSEDACETDVSDEVFQLKNRAVVEFQSSSAARKALKGPKMAGFRVTWAPGHTAQEALGALKSEADWDAAFGKKRAPEVAATECGSSAVDANEEVREI